jgi:hypothetical protein
MTDLERRAIAAVGGCAFPKELWHGRRARELYLFMLEHSDWPLKVEESADLWFLVWTYRRQIADAEVVMHADEMVSGALYLAL